MDLVLVRHAEPVRIAEGDTDGRPADPELTAQGRQQSERLADWLAYESFDTILVSPKRRAIETARPVALRLGIEPVVDPELNEYDSESTFYIPIEEMRRNNDPRFTAMVEGNWEELGGGTPAEFRARIDRALTRIVGEHPGQRVLAVCHGGVINVALALAAGLDRELWFGPEYTSISRIVASRSGIRSVQSINETGHLVARHDA